MPRKEITQWIAIDKQMAKGQGQSGDLSSVEEDVIDEDKLMQVFGVHQALTFYGYMNMKTSIDFPISPEQGDQSVEGAVQAILMEKNRRI